MLVIKQKGLGKALTELYRAVWAEKAARPKVFGF
jgi:hypothetical protein